MLKADLDGLMSAVHCTALPWWFPWWLYRPWLPVWLLARSTFQMQGIKRGRVLWHRMRFVERSSGRPYAIDWLYVRQTFNFFLKQVNNTLTLSMKLWTKNTCRMWTPVGWDIHIVRGAGTSAVCWPTSQSFLGILVCVQLHNPLTYGCFTTMAYLEKFWTPYDPIGIS